MPFKIYTYEDPYKLDKADFWSEISALPHFCSARTLVNGLKDVLGDNIKGLICPLDELVQHEEVYMQWTDNISLRVQQYSAFSSAFKQLLEKRRISKPFHMALEQNQNHFLEAIRLFIELDISASAIMNCPNLLDGVNDGELVVVPKDVNNELEHHKTRFGADDRKFKAQKAITAIFNYKRRFPLAYADGLLSLVPEAYRAKADEKEQNDNKILAVALRYKIYTDIPVFFITDDRSLSNKASGEGLEVWTSKDFLAPPETSFDDESPAVPEKPAAIPVMEAQIAEVPAAEVPPAQEISGEGRLDAEAAETERRAKAKEEYLAQKISTKLLHLEASQISLLQNNGIKTIADFMAQTENSFASMKVKKGIPFTARFLKEQETIRCKLENL